MKAIIVGAGEVGFHIANHMAFEKKDVAVIDMNPEALGRVSDRIDVETILGSGSSPIVLEKAGIADADLFLAVTDSDEVNLIACMMADILSPAIKKLARIRNADWDSYHEHFRNSPPHVNTIINPEIEVVKTIFRLIKVPGTTEVEEFAGGAIKLVGVHLDESAPLCGIRLADMRTKTGTHRPLIAAIIRNEELIIPAGKDQLLAGDEVYFVEKEDRLLETLPFFNKENLPVQRVMIVGGGSIGLRLAEILEDTSIQVTIVEKKEDRCLSLADRLDKATVIHGDGSDQALLEEENIHTMDMTIMVTDDEEINIIASLLAKRMGTKKVITKISRFSYFSLMAGIGIEKVVSPRLSAINSILQHIRKGKVLSAISIRGEQAEVIEAEVMTSSGIVGKPLKDISLPNGVLFTGIVHEGHVSIPSGESIVHLGDRVVLFARKEAVPKLEKMLAFKLEYA